MITYNNTTKARLRKKFDRMCNTYRHALEIMWGLDIENGYWANDNVGGVYCNGDDLQILLIHILYCIENDIPLELYKEHYEKGMSDMTIGKWFEKKLKNL